MGNAKKKSLRKSSAVGERFSKVVRYDGAEVRVSERSNGFYLVKWREDGGWKSTTRAEVDVAVSFAEGKAKAIAGKRGMQWVRPGEAEVLEGLRRLAGNTGESGSVAEVFGELKAAVELLGGAGSGGAAGGGVRLLRKAAEYYVSHGPGGVVDIRLHDALDLVRKEYDFSRSATRNTMRVAIDAMKRLMPDGLLAEVKREDVERFVFEKDRSVRTARNRISQAGTFFARCKVLEMWPEARPLPTAAIKKPRLPDLAPEIFTPAQGKKIYAAVKKECPRYLPYLVLAGWMGCRPSECLRLRWEALDLENGMLHLSSEVVGKTARERWIPMDARVKAKLLELRAVAVNEGGGEPQHKVCLTHSREEISKLARSKGMRWPADVLRHSAITYALQLSGNNYNKTAERMGNSPAVIESNYRRPIPAGRGEEWMDVIRTS